MKTDAIELVNSVVSEIMTSLDFPYNTIEVFEEDGVLRINIQTDRAPFLLEHMEIDLMHCNTLSKKFFEDEFLTQRKKRREFLLSWMLMDTEKIRKRKYSVSPEKKADATRNSQISQLMPSLDPYMRKQVHLCIKEEYPELTTRSIDGEGPRKRIQILVA